MSNIVNLFGLQPPKTLPDHSFLVSTFETHQAKNTFQFNSNKNSNPKNTQNKPKKNLKKLDENFFMNEHIFQQIQVTINRIENNCNNQLELDALWNDIKSLFLTEMSKLPDLPTSNFNKTQNKFRKSQPFWNKELDRFWKEVCRTENEYLSFKVRNNFQLPYKNQLKSNYKYAQKLYDKKFRYYKRSYRKQEYDDLGNLSDTNPSEMWAKLKRLSEPPSSRAALEIVREDGSISNDIKEILERWHQDISLLFSGFRENPDMVFDEHFYNEIKSKKEEFENISPEDQQPQGRFNSSNLNSDLSFVEVSKCIDTIKLRKAYLDIPNEVTKNLNAKSLLHKFFNLCFSSGLSPSDWDYSNIKPIEKKDKDPRDPLNNRCITIMCCISKIYSKILNTRLQKYVEDNKILVEEQNGFRASRSCIDHIFTLCTIIRNRKALGYDTFLSFIDYKKAFDSVDRHLLLYKLSQIGISGRFYSAIQSMYKNPKSRVILNEFENEYFDCPIGVKQGDCLSPTLFAIFINDLAEEIKSCGVRLQLDSDTFVNILLYADDIVLLAESEGDLQFLLLIVENWCKKWRLEVNLSKTNILHIRSKRKSQSNFMFLFDKQPVPYCSMYKYLGCTINEYFDTTATVSLLADSAGRALSSIITKMIKNGGFPYNVFSTLYQACVCSISDYGGEVFGFKLFDSALKIHLRAARSFLGVPKTAPIAGIISEINLLLPQSRTQIKMVRQLHRILKMENERLTKKVFFWDKKLNEEKTIISWSSEVKTIFAENLCLDTFESGEIFNLKQIVGTLEENMIVTQQATQKDQCENLPKLRTFIKFKDFSCTPVYLKKPLSFIQRKFIAKLRLGCLEIRLETGRWARPRLPEESRICLVCPNQDQEPESELHFLFKCSTYQHERQSWLQKLTIPENFQELQPEFKLDLVLNNPDNVKITSQYVINIFDKRSKIVSKLPSIKDISIFHLLPQDQCPACKSL